MPGLFQDTMLSAAFDARRILRRVATYSQSPDHPDYPDDPGDGVPQGICLRGRPLSLILRRWK